MPSTTDAARALDAFRACRDEVKHEYNVLSTRLVSYLTSQSFLVSAFAISMGNMNATWGSTFRTIFPLLLALLGIALSIQARPGILGSCQVIFQWHIRQDQLLCDHPELEDFYGPDRGAITKTHQRSLWFPTAAPYTFGTAWIAFGALVIYLATIQSSRS